MLTPCWWRSRNRARIGRTTGHGIAGNVCRHYPNWLFMALLRCCSSPIPQHRADLSMADAVSYRLAAGCMSFFGTVCVVAIVFKTYAKLRCSAQMADPQPVRLRCRLVRDQDAWRGAARMPVPRIT
jgi:hypothetical protein